MTAFASRATTLVQAAGLLSAIVVACTSCTDNPRQGPHTLKGPGATVPPSTTAAVEEPVEADPVVQPPIGEPAEVTADEEPVAAAAADPAVPEGAAAEAAEAEPEMDDSGMDDPEVAERNPLAGCQQCHVDVEDEFTPSLHFAEKVACVDCHGLSEGHLADENNEIKPDVVFIRENTDPLCEECHGCSRPEDSQPAEAPPEGEAICTDCHGHHEMTLTTKGG